MPDIFVPGFEIHLIGTSLIIFGLLMTGSSRLEVVTESVAGDAMLFGADDTTTDEDAFAHGAITLLKDRKTGPLPKPRRLTWRGGSMALKL